MPLYLIPLLAYLVWMGVRRLSPRTMSVLRLLIAPAVFIGMGVFGLLSRPDLSTAVVVWGAGAMLGFLPGAAFAQPLAVDRVQGLVRTPGSIAPLARIAVLFALHFACHTVAAVRPDLAHAALTADLGVYGAGAGYFAGWLMRFVQAYSAAPDTDLGGSARLARA